MREGIELTGDQRAALRTVVSALPEPGRASAASSFLLHGVTGSGKTEVYLEAAREALARGRGAIVLVPEIALTPQTMDRFRRRFGDSVALLHSRMPAGARYDEWRRLRSGEARICVGPRSAVFAPVRGSRPDRDRRGARLLLQAGERSPLRRARGRATARRRRRRGAALRDGDAAARELA